MNSTLPYTEVTTPMSRTRPARLLNRSDSSRGRPYSLASMAPATLNRSVIVEPISASSCIDSRVSRCSLRPISLAGRMNSGSMTSAMSVTSQDR